jgi:uncharacterized protein (TIGR03435 family)
MENAMRTLLIAVCGAAAVVAAARAQDKAPSFEVATVKQNKSGDTNGMLQRQPGGRMTAANMPMKPLITFAYQIAPYQLVGGPGWLNSTRYDIVAKMEGDPAPVAPGAGTDPMQLALQNLLSERFKLKVHHETREMDIYALVMLKPGSPGPQLKPTSQDCAAAAAAARRGTPLTGSNAPFCGTAIGPGNIRFGGLPASQIATTLAALSGRFVADRTGLNGSWDFTLTFAPEQRGQAPGANAASDSDLPSYFTAIQEQLGLKLESTKGPVDVVVIDSIENPKDDD